jgi:hypothetical protein
MKVKSVSMIEDETGRRYAYPAVVFDFPEVSGIVDAVKMLRKAGYSLVRLQGDRAILRQHNAYRYICVR